MLTVKQILPIIRYAKLIQLVWGGGAKTVDFDDALDREIYGNLVVQTINVFDDRSVELIIAVRTVKAEEGQA